MSDPLEDMGAHRPGSSIPEAAPAAPPTDAQIRARRKSRSLVMAVLLGAFVVLMFAITIAKMKTGQ